MSIFFYSRFCESLGLGICSLGPRYWHTYYMSNAQTHFLASDLLGGTPTYVSFSKRISIPADENCTKLKEIYSKKMIHKTYGK